MPPRPNRGWLHLDLLHGMANMAGGFKILLNIEQILTADGLLQAASIV